jgi:hypothetical protein
MSIKVYLTSFWRSRYLANTKAYSIALSQPEGFSLPELVFLKPIKDGRWLKKDGKDYRKEYDSALKSNQREVAEWMDKLGDEDVALCCWCRSKEYQLDRCHRILISIMLKRMRPDLDVKLDLRNPAWRR